MKKGIIALLKIVIPLGLGVFLIWLVFKDLTDSDIADIKKSFQETNYFFIGLSILFGIFSHMSRAWRWKYPLKKLGYTISFKNSFYTVMVGYFANLGIPRSGEVMRCGLMAKSENIPFNKLVGTVIAERVADLIILVLFIFSVVFIQFETLENYLVELGVVDSFSITKLLIIGVIGLAGMLGAYIVFKRSNNAVILKIRDFLKGIFDGIKTIATMKDKWYFIFHTLFIWFMYFLMFYITFFSLADIQQVPIGGILTAFVIGGISIAATNGGIGAYPLGIASVLALYGVAENTGYAFGWAVWTAQTLMIVSLGLLSLILISRAQKK